MTAGRQRPAKGTHLSEGFRDEGFARGCTLSRRETRVDHNGLTGGLLLPKNSTHMYGVCEVFFESRRVLDIGMPS